MIVREDQIQWKSGHGIRHLSYAYEIAELVRRGEISENNKIDIDDICEGNPKEVGRIYLIETRFLREKKYKKIADFLTSEDSPYRKEYDSLRKRQIIGVVSIDPSA